MTEINRAAEALRWARREVEASQGGRSDAVAWIDLKIAQVEGYPACIHCKHTLYPDEAQVITDWFRPEAQGPAHASCDRRALHEWQNSR
jgi:hypothetical protein